MRKIARLALVGVTVAASLLLSGCVQPPPVVSTSPTPTVTPLFESDAAALAAATKAYAAYLAMEDLVAQEGGANPERLAPFVTSEWLAKEKKSFDTSANSGNHQEGKTSFDRVRLQSVEDNGGKAIITVYLCLDVSKARILDKTDVDVTPSRTREVFPFAVKFIKPSSSTAPLLAGSDPWQGSNFC